MKSIFALALLGAVAVADDAADKAAVVDKVNYGVDTPPLSKAIPLNDVKITTGGKDKGVIKMATGVKITGGTDSQTYFQFMWQIVPGADYDPNDELKKIAFAASSTATSPKSAYVEFRNSKTNSGLDVINYNFLTLETSVTDLAARDPPAELTADENTKLLTNKFYWTTVDGNIVNNQVSVDDTHWDAVVADSKLEMPSGAETIVLQRKGAGVEELKAGGAADVLLRYVDKDGTQIHGPKYVKWADADKEESDGAFSMTASAALAAAAIAALF